MSLFDLLFLLLFLVSVITLLTAAVLALRGKGARALGIVKLWIVCAVSYLAIGHTVSGLTPQKVMNVGEDWCFDDWCLRVAKVQQSSAGAQAEYKIDLLISSKMGRPQRAKGAWIYLLDDDGKKYSPAPSPDQPALDVLLAPREEVRTSRVFQVPASAHIKGLVTGHGGPYCGVMNFLIIGQSGCLFHKPAMIRIPG